MTRPVRLRLSRAKGFDLQALSRATNGLDAVNVARPSKWGNPYRCHHPGSPFEEPMSNQAAALAFKFLVAKEGGWFPVPLPWRPKGKLPLQWTSLDDVRSELRGKNLACWCKSGEPCHADVLLELANGDAK